MTTASPAACRPQRGTLDEFLAADDIAPLPEIGDGEWDAIRRDAGRRLAWRFCTLRNLVTHRGRFAFDAMGFAWGGIYRTLLVSSIVTTSFRNEGHFRAGEQIGGTSDFFSGAFAFPRSSAEFAEIVGMVNLRHHVAGVVTPAGDGRVRVVPGYEADYAYVATAFIESIRRGLGLCGLAPDSPAGRALAAQVCTILYQLAGFTGLTRMPRDLADIRGKSQARQALGLRPDVAALHHAYHESVHVNIDDDVDDRLVGAILLHAIDADRAGGPPLERRSLDLAPGGALIRQGEYLGEMYVVLSSSAPLIVMHAADGAEPRQVAVLAAPTVLGEIGMWRGQPAVATVTTREANRLELLVIDKERFESLKEEPGFRAATAAEVQRRLALNSALVGTLLDDTAARTGSPLLASIAQLFRFLTGDSHVALDAVVDLPVDATPDECVEALRRQVDEAIRAGGLPPELERYLGNVVATSTPCADSQ